MRRIAALGALIVGACLAVPGASAPQATAAARVRLTLDGPAMQGGLVLGRAGVGTDRLTLDGRDVPIAPDRRFVIAFDRDAPPTATLVESGRDAADVWRTELPITVAPRAWRIERLDRLAKIPVPSPDFARRRPAELAQINAARRSVASAQGWRQRFVWPVTGRISGLFGSQRIYRGEPGSYHSGVDVARATGTPVVAPADGVVILAADSPFTLEGNLLMIDHGMGLNSAFLHLSRIDVAVGEYIRQGEQIGLVGATGRATGAHLHWGMKWGTARIDPLLVTGPMR